MAGMGRRPKRKTEMAWIIFLFIGRDLLKSEWEPSNVWNTE
jgi:hypothetical protein